LERRLARLPDNVRFVPIDFNVESIDSALSRSGFHASQPAMFIWEGVSQYLQPSAVDSVLRSIASMAPDTELIFTYVLEEAITGRFRADRADALRNVTSRLPELWLFGIEPSDLKAFLAERGLLLCEDRAPKNTPRVI
jgi:methyltransferase (TIGR00027 family)